MLQLRDLNSDAELLVFLEQQLDEYRMLRRAMQTLQGATPGCVSLATLSARSLMQLPLFDKISDPLRK